MARVLVLSKEREFKGPFSQCKILWNAIETLQGIEPTKNSEPIDSLVLQDDDGKITGTLESGTEKQFTTCTYAHLCVILRKDNKAAFHDAQTFDPLYGVWQGEMNEIYGEDKEENKDE